MEKHVDLLGMLYMIWGALSLLAGGALWILGAGALSIVMTSSVDERAPEVAAALTALMFGLLGAVALAWGLLNIVAGRALREPRRRASTRIAALILASLDLFFVPFGTALGSYALWVLLHRQGRLLFEPAAP
jgi:hypothetical protein